MSSINSKSSSISCVVEIKYICRNNEIVLNLMFMLIFLTYLIYTFLEHKTVLLCNICQYWQPHISFKWTTMWQGPKTVTQERGRDRSYHEVARRSHHRLLITELHEKNCARWLERVTLTRTGIRKWVSPIGRLRLSFKSSHSGVFDRKARAKMQIFKFAQRL